MRVKYQDAQDDLIGKWIGAFMAGSDDKDGGRKARAEKAALLKAAQNQAGL